MAPFSMKERFKTWLGHRYDLDAFHRFFEGQVKKPLPKNINWFHTLGSMALFLFVSQVLTGILLLIYYRPTVKEAFGSVRFIMTEAYMGWLYRQIHAWGANLMIIFVFFHMPLLSRCDKHRAPLAHTPRREALDRRFATWWRISAPSQPSQHTAKNHVPRRCAGLIDLVPR